ncbi:hypothetical protein FSP39_023214 [Pinctada imbricata]|uniref:Soluble calcium-activated nucleotidase 1 n=1 Tax=Pinctada imbricata TaxID=66713 RepID=A0AA88XT51_PINIB|nr:hypothetical protein FSP39_023214 [Pinctada imbricata]
MDAMKSINYSTSVHDWMNAIRRPTPYRVGSSRFYLKPRILAYSGLFSFAVLILIVSIFQSHPSSSLDCLKRWDSSLRFHGSSYDYTYPLTPIISKGSVQHFKIGLVTDLDTDSKSKDKKDTWFSYFHEGNLTYSQSNEYIDIKLNAKPYVLKSTLSQGGRGMELSELQVFNGKLYSVDDRTGVIYQVSHNHQVFPWVLLADGDGNTQKGFKCEWATVKDKRLYVGGLGKEWTTVDGVVQNVNPQFIKSIGVNGDVIHLDWHENYNAMRKKAGFTFPGYIIHESGVWSEIHQRWFFMPRRASTEKYEEKADEKRATNLLIIANDDFSDIEMKHIGVKHPTRGYSSFKFLPHTNDHVIVALKSEEDAGKIASYISAFTLDGKVLLKERYLGNVKYEGIEFI